MRRLLSFLLLTSPLMGQSVALTWTASPSGGKVNVYRAHNACSNKFTRIATNVPAAGPYTDSVVVDGATYAYQVTAVVAGSESVPSNCIVVSIPTPTPTPPTNLTATPAP